MNNIKTVILDFDGTCTQIPFVHEEFLANYLKELNGRLTASQQISDVEWKATRNTVKENSPRAGWTLSTTASAPAAADPYILAGEATKLIFKNKGIISSAPADAFKAAYAANPAPWRTEAAEVIGQLLKKNIAVHFVSNSDTKMIEQRTRDLFGSTGLPAGIDFHGSANKYNINESDVTEYEGWPEQLKKLYDGLPAALPDSGLGRPIYLRRGSYFSIIAAIFNQDLKDLDKTVFCGDIWELDLALPSVLGASLHLIERSAPYKTYPYEKKLTIERQGKISTDLRGLLSWILKI